MSYRLTANAARTCRTGQVDTQANARGGRPDASVVAHELGLSVRTLQRRIVDEGTTFRGILSEVRKELAREYLSRPGIPLTEVAFLLGFEDTSSFYRAFRAWQKATPERWRAESGDSDPR